MYSRNERHTAFAVISSFILKLTEKEFPFSRTVNINNLLDETTNAGARFFLESYGTLVEPSITWLADEGYIRVKYDEDNLTMTLTKLGAQSTGLKLEQTGAFLQNFITEDNGVFFTSCDDSSAPAVKKKVRITGPALAFMPENWLG